MAKDYHFTPFRPHPWHGIPRGPNPPAVVNAYIEITPFDVIKYEIDRRTGYLRVDRPQASSSLPPVLYGIVPRTLAGMRVAKLTEGATEADGDALDICIISEAQINRSEVLLSSRIIGGLSTLDRGKVDDKLVSILESDKVWRDVNELEELPKHMIDRIEHYFSTYKMEPGGPNRVEILGRYGRERAQETLQAAFDDYDECFGEEMRKHGYD